MSKSDSEGNPAEATANAEQVNDSCQPSIEARNYVFRQSTKNQLSKKPIKRSKTYSKTLVDLQLEEQELEREAKAQKKPLEAEMHMKTLIIG